MLVPFEPRSQNFTHSVQRGFQIASKQPNGTNTNPSFHSLGIDPRSWLKNSKVVGEEDVGGVTTKHISADLDVNKLIEDINKLLARASKLGLSQRGIPSTITPTQQENFAKALALGMVVIVAVVMTLYVVLQRRTARWLR